ncbi:hypothetical protein [Paenibacillus polymyxa]|uniref:hypothetical protein n=1 Tax=Paenibacillus polymyxa TaxID=1406 RepID=UPI0017830302|nr:hypothetical protein [Paenibacillus polymyxa]QOH62388.1 hypothetical protein DI243_13780 [Paenibacillus polymyxa]
MTKTILKELNGRVLVKVEYNLDLLANEKPAYLYEFWNSREDFEESERNEYASEEAVTGEKKCRSVYNLSDEEALNFFDSLQ